MEAQAQLLSSSASAPGSGPSACLRLRPNPVTEDQLALLHVHFLHIEDSALTVTSEAEVNR